MGSPRAILPVLAIASSLTLVWRASPNGQGTAAIPPPEGPVIAGLDHVPIAVGDLDAAAARYRALGFALKPGRPHANGIRNQHAKFADDGGHGTTFNQLHRIKMDAPFASHRIHRHDIGVM